MIIIERMIQEIDTERRAELDDLDKRYEAIESTLGFPPKKRFWTVSSPYNSNVIILERQWESMAAMEAAYEKSFAHPGIQALYTEGAGIVKSSRSELYTPME